ncbi:hypothetical protein PSHT_06266 [Puccinia striiformis]|uniref:MIT domain-containing protein n=1 Tax=Puccinia striiformis TaxID=27350 RepID=A0A2S4W7T6_9BASI|nr:hypothetical protein KEM48_007999 [Puccinia striiformis f. sp. tritici PST-130]POW17819.1 hypothetical protein PSHT_06266 [Puccinia striiformis]
MYRPRFAYKSKTSITKIESEPHFLESAVETSLQAIDEENKQNWEESWRLYKNALDDFHTAHNYAIDPKLKDSIRSEIQEFSTRVEKLKLRFQAPDDEQVEPVVSVSEKDTNGEGDSGAVHAGGNDADAEKLRGGLPDEILVETPIVRYDDIAGLTREKDSLRSAHSRRKRVLLHGTSGPGMMCLAQAAAGEIGDTFFSIRCSDLLSKPIDESERLLKQLFKVARANKQAMVYIDGVDLLCGTSEAESEPARRIRTELTFQMDPTDIIPLERSTTYHMGPLGVDVVGATEYPWRLESDVAFLEMFDEHICVPLFEKSVKVQQDLPMSPSGMSASDIVGSARDARMQPPVKVVDATHFGTSIIPRPDDADTENLRGCLPGEILVETPIVRYDDIAGLKEAKDSLRSASERRQRVLLYGTSGFGMMCLAQAAAGETGNTFFSVRCSDLLSKPIDESERLLKKLFQVARENKRAMIYIDGVDLLCGTSEGGESEPARRIRTELTLQTDPANTKLPEPVNSWSTLSPLGYPWRLESDVAFLEMFDEYICVPLLEGNVKAQQDLPMRPSGLSASDLVGIARDARMQPFLKVLDATHFKILIIPHPDYNDWPPLLIEMLTPCSPEDPLAIEKKWHEIGAKELLVPYLKEPGLSGNSHQNAQWVVHEDNDKHWWFQAFLYEKILMKRRKP